MNWIKECVACYKLAMEIEDERPDYKKRGEQRIALLLNIANAHAGEFAGGPSDKAEDEPNDEQ